MVHSTAISWKIGLAVAASALSFCQVPAWAEDASPEKAEVPRQPVEPTVVRVIMLPAASDDLFALRPPDPTKGQGAGHVIMVKPADESAGAPPSPEFGKTEETAASATPKAAREAVPRVASLKPAEDSTIARPEAEPAKAGDDAVSAVAPSVPERSPQVSSLAPGDKAAATQSRPAPSKARLNRTFVKIPDLPERRPFLATINKTEPAERGPTPVASFEEPAPEPSPVVAKVNSAVRFLGKLWPGSKRESEPEAANAEGWQGSIASNASEGADKGEQDQADAETPNDEADGKRKSAFFPKSLRFWD